MSWLSRLLNLFRRRTVPVPVPQPTGDIPATLLRLHNEQRRLAGVHPLTINEKLAQAAQQYAESEEVSHRPETHGNWMERIRATGYSGPYVAENIAQGQRSAEEAVADWLRSPGHYRNMVDERFADVGFGRAGEYWVVDFGG